MCLFLDLKRNGLTKANGEGRGFFQIMLGFQSEMVDFPISWRGYDDTNKLLFSILQSLFIFTVHSTTIGTSCTNQLYYLTNQTKYYLTCARKAVVQVLVATSIFFLQKAQTRLYYYKRTCSFAWGNCIKKPAVVCYFRSTRTIQCIELLGSPKTAISHTLP